MKTITVIFVLCAFASSARADDERYAKRIVASDVASAGAFVTGLGILIANSLGEYSEPSATKTVLGGTLMIGGIISYVATPAIMHAMRGNGRSSMRSIVSRLGLPMLFGLTGAALSNDDAAALGVVLGLGTAMALDWFVFAKQTRPVVVPTREGVTVGLAGTF